MEVNLKRVVIGYTVLGEFIIALILIGLGIGALVSGTHLEPLDLWAWVFALLLPPFYGVVFAGSILLHKLIGQSVGDLYMSWVGDVKEELNKGSR